MTLAQIQNVTPEHAHQITLFLVGAIVVLAALGSFVIQLLNYARGQRPQPRQVEPQPLEVKAAERLVTAEKCRLLQTETNRRLQWLEGEGVSLRRDMKADRELLGRQLLEEVGKVHERINALLEAVGELRGEIKRGREGEPGRGRTER